MSVKTKETLKQLQTRLSKLQAEEEFLKIDSKEAQRKLSQCQARMAKVKEEMDTLKEVELIVSEHAVLRYMERAMDMNIDMIKEAIQNNKMIKSAHSMGDGKYPMGDGLKAVIKDGVVVSITN